jgi:hypothetical protein
MNILLEHKLKDKRTVHVDLGAHKHINTAYAPSHKTLMHAMNAIAPVIQERTEVIYS